MREKLLVADDEPDIVTMLKNYFELNGYDVLTAANGLEAVAQAEKQPDLILLDIMLPGCNGYELLQYAQSMGLPVIFLTALGTTENKVKGLKMGADDYLAKPFAIPELLARVETVLRRYHKSEGILKVFDITIDTASRLVMREGKQIALTLKEFDLLLLLARNRNIALYRETIYESVWGGEYEGQSRTIDLHVQRLKKKLGWNEEITAVYKVGYRLEGET